MSSSKITTTPIWRDFEKLVARIEQVLAGDSVRITSPDRIPSLITGRLREVDASIRARVGSVELLITIECRKRQARQDVTWMEQLGSKKQAVGAARTIAVASSAFSNDAIQAAELYGIDLRVLSEISDAEMQSWLLPSVVVHVFKQCELAEPPHISYYLEQDDDVNGSASSVEGDTPVAEAHLFVGSDGMALSLSDVWLRVDDQLKIFDGVPLDDKVHLRRLNLTPSDNLQVHTAVGLRRVHSIYMALSLRWKHECIPLGAANIVAYQPVSIGDPMRRQIRAEFQSNEHPTSNILFGVQFQNGEDKVTCTVEFTPGTKP